MNKTYSESELEGFAQKTFEQYPTAKEIFVTEDGQCFLMKNRAELHAGAKGKVYTFEKKTEAEKPAPKMNAKDTIAAIKAAETLEALAAFSADDRKSVVEAYNKRKLKLDQVKETVVESPEVVNEDNTNPETAE